VIFITNESIVHFSAQLG